METQIALMQRERTRASFDSRSLAAFLAGGADKQARMEELRRAFLSDPAFSKEQRIFGSHKENYRSSLAKMRAFHDKLAAMRVTNYEEIAWCYRAVDELLPSETHLAMFVPAIAGQTSPEQRAKWLPLAENCAILGAYAQTELGHGSNVRGLETLAVYDPARQEFDIHSPTISSMKWWPGGLGKTCTHAIVYARLITQGKDHGVHGFIVPLRSLDNHQPLPGIELGDIGPKVGFNTLDNGYARFTHVRIPRDHMLMGFSKVEADGTYIPAPHAKVGYAPMLHVRANIVIGAAGALSRALTIVIRYSAVRRQGNEGADGRERQVLDYTLQQWTLFPLLATAFAMHFTGRTMKQLYVKLQQGLQEGDLSLLPEVHATSAGLKALTTQIAADGIEACRKACGGHGYSHFSGIPEMLFNYLASNTVEGTSDILTQQTARYLLKSLAAARLGKPVGPHCSYLLHHAHPERLACTAATKTDLSLPSVLLQVLEARALRLALAAESALQHAAATAGKEEAWNLCLVTLARLSHAHCHAFMVRCFFESLSDPSLPAPLLPVLSRLARLHAWSVVVRDAGEFLHSNMVTSAHVDSMMQLAMGTLKELRPDAVALVDSWSWPDEMLNSEIGRYDGDAYQRLYDAARNREPLNKTEVPEGYEESIKPLLQAGARRAKLAAKL